MSLLRKKMRLPDLQKMVQRGEKIACLTVYDAGFARLLDAAEVDVMLVGDSLGMVLAGQDNTLAVRMVDMVYHTRLVATGRQSALLVADMPFLSYTTPVQALGNAGRLLSAGADMVKLEGGEELQETVRLLTASGIPVCGHLGLTPQSVNQLGGYLPQGFTSESEERLIQGALTLAHAGIAMLVLECVSAGIAAAICQQLTIPVIGIGAGARCHGQVLVLYDILGISEKPKRFYRVFLNQDTGSIQAAIQGYVKAVKDGTFPTKENEY